jgi:hypothetical protein
MTCHEGSFPSLVAYVERRPIQRESPPSLARATDDSREVKSSTTQRGGAAALLQDVVTGSRVGWPDTRRFASTVSGSDPPPYLFCSTSCQKTGEGTPLSRRQGIITYGASLGFLLTGCWDPRFIFFRRPATGCCRVQGPRRSIDGRPSAVVGFPVGCLCDAMEKKKEALAARSCCSASTAAPFGWGGGRACTHGWAAPRPATAIGPVPESL